MELQENAPTQNINTFTEEVEQAREDDRVKLGDAAPDSKTTYKDNAPIAATGWRGQESQRPRAIRPDPVGDGPWPSCDDRVSQFEGTAYTLAVKVKRVWCRTIGVMALMNCVQSPIGTWTMPAFWKSSGESADYTMGTQVVSISRSEPRRTVQLSFCRASR
ncbi:uncharacterized protein N7529_003973 [Penicillium soppii]|uniref:uncharacterized protein n=1 Tax=Penicillium soppii TaxID=69789 RepID=UPI0025488E9B|nr:uncharacterized protein N7529_003973 [Penicillium soppii]KAJ5871620.1 hypothetical protein N7529_003973 [Penicillium soppii]